MSRQIESIEPTARYTSPRAVGPAAPAVAATAPTAAHEPASAETRPAEAAAPSPPAPSPGHRGVRTAPEYTLLLETGNAAQPGRWRFRVRAADGTQQFEAGDVEPDARGERLSLLTAVRALESLDGPACVRLLGAGRYVRQGITYGLPEWRENGWRWECFGRMVPVRDRDLWQRLDRALRFHQVDCRVWRRDAPHPTPLGCRTGAPKQDRAPRLRTRVAVAWGRLRQWLEVACGARRAWRGSENEQSQRKLAGAVG